jgi:hypothetical protein
VGDPHRAQRDTQQGGADLYGVVRTVGGHGRISLKLTMAALYDCAGALQISVEASHE